MKTTKWRFGFEVEMDEEGPRVIKQLSPVMIEESVEEEEEEGEENEGK